MKSIRWPWAGKIGWAIALLFLFNVAVLFGPKLFEPTPYKNVKLVRVEETQGYISITANFTKVGCTFNRLIVVGFAGGESDILKWKDNDGLAPDHDREPGEQTLDIRVRTQGIQYDKLEIRVRHICGNYVNDPVDTVFLTLDNLTDLRELPEGHYDTETEKG